MKKKNKNRPVRVAHTDARKAAVKEMMRFAEGRRLGKLSLRQLIEAGRPF